MSRTAPFPDDLASDALDALVSDLVATRAMMSALHAHEATVLAGVMAVADAAAAVGDRSEAELHHRSVAAEGAAGPRRPHPAGQRPRPHAAPPDRAVPPPPPPPPAGGGGGGGNRPPGRTPLPPPAATAVG